MVSEILGGGGGGRKICNTTILYYLFIGIILFNNNPLFRLLQEGLGGGYKKRVQTLPTGGGILKTTHPILVWRWWQLNQGDRLHTSKMKGYRVYMWILWQRQWQHNRVLKWLWINNNICILPTQGCVCIQGGRNEKVVVPPNTNIYASRT